MDEELVKKADTRMLMWEKGRRGYLLSGTECKQLDRERAIMKRQMELIQRGVDKMGWTYRGEEWQKLWKRSGEILEKCGHNIEHI